MSFLRREKSQKNGPVGMKKDRKDNGSGQKDKRGDSKVESNVSPEIPGRWRHQASLVFFQGPEQYNTQCASYPLARASKNHGVQWRVAQSEHCWIIISCCFFSFLNSHQYYRKKIHVPMNHNPWAFHVYLAFVTLMLSLCYYFCTGVYTSMCLCVCVCMCVMHTSNLVCT